jgi:saccharopine dehydrogenase-like NADP-dependent oxidoreductase
MGQTWRAISWTTAASLVSVIEMINEGLLKKEGFIKQEEIPFDKFLKTDSGKLFLD